MQQQWDVAQGFDVERGEFCQQPVLRQAADADQGAEDGRQDDADYRHLEGVQHADQQRSAVGVDRRVVGEQGLADRDAGDTVEEAEAGGDVAGGEVALVLRTGTSRSVTTISTIRICQTMERKTGSVQEVEAPLGGGPKRR